MVRKPKHKPKPKAKRKANPIASNHKRDDSYCPSQAEIRRLCLEIQSTWSDATRRRRKAVRNETLWTVPEIPLPANFDAIEQLMASEDDDEQTI